LAALGRDDFELVFDFAGDFARLGADRFFALDLVWF
jgi:hypothetical protein